MFIVKLEGGLGNQMFQYAFAKKLSIRFDKKLKLDIQGYSDKSVPENYTKRHFALNSFALKYEIASNNDIQKLRLYSNNKFIRFYNLIYRKLLNYEIITEKNYDFSKNYRGSLYYITGYWQSQNYFQDVRDDLLNCFKLNYIIDAESNNLLSKIVHSNSVSIHIRRGDYITNKAAFEVHTLCSLEYYQSAIKFIMEHVPDPTFYIFSDDLKWVRDNIKFNAKIEIVENSIPETEQYLMSKCKHNIIANSSFSWWAAWLNNNSSKIVIAPKNWFKIPQGLKFEIPAENWLKM